MAKPPLGVVTSANQQKLSTQVEKNDLRAQKPLTLGLLAGAVFTAYALTQFQVDDPETLWGAHMISLMLGWSFAPTGFFLGTIMTELRTHPWLAWANRFVVGCGMSIGMMLLTWAYFAYPAWLALLEQRTQ